MLGGIAVQVIGLERAVTGREIPRRVGVLEPHCAQLPLQPGLLKLPVAGRGWITPDDVLSTRSIGELRSLLRRTMR